MKKHGKIKSMAVFLFVAAFVLLLGAALTLLKPKEIKIQNTLLAQSNTERVEILKKKGVNVENEPFEVRQIVIPNEFNTLLNELERVQKEQGLSLEGYKGQKATLYSYPLKNEKGRFAQIIVHHNQIIGACVITYGEKGEFSKLFLD